MSEESHASLFASGWRPFIGWVCGASLAYCFIVRDILGIAIKLYDPAYPEPSPIAFDYLVTILGGMLGLGGMRTFEKVKGVDTTPQILDKKK